MSEQPDRDEEQTPEQPESALSRAAAQGPLPGIHDEADDDAAGQPSPTVASGTGSDEEPPGVTLDDEAEQVIGFRGLR